MRTSDRQPTVVGLCSFTHDSAAALITDGRLTGMAEEERLSGVKHTREYPAAAVQWLLDDAGLAAADVDIVAYNFAGHRYLAGIAGTPRHLLPPATRSPCPASRRELRRHPSPVPAAHEDTARPLPERAGALRPASHGSRHIRVRRVGVQ